MQLILVVDEALTAANSTILKIKVNYFGNDVLIEDYSCTIDKMTRRTPKACATQSQQSCMIKQKRTW